jgi:hypothetical protein
MLKLNDLHYSACDKYSLYLQTGNISFKMDADKMMVEYKNRGGKKELKYHG